MKNANFNAEEIDLKNIEFRIESQASSYPVLDFGLTPQCIFDFLKDKNIIEFGSIPAWGEKGSVLQNFLKKNLKYKDCERLKKILKAQIIGKKIDVYSFAILAALEAKIFLSNLIAETKNRLEEMGIFSTQQNDEEKNRTAQIVIGLESVRRLSDKKDEFILLQ